jgi:Rap1-interacting factor 1 N terminal
MVPSSTLTALENLPARPPTPPRTTTHGIEVEAGLDSAVNFLDSSFEVERLTSLTSKPSRKPIDTPQQQSPLEAWSSTRSKKKVDFKPFNEWKYHKYQRSQQSAENITTATPEKTNPRLSPPKIKSILKPSKPPSERSPASSKNASPGQKPAHNYSNLQEMFEALSQQLASGGPVERRDAYNALLRSLQKYKTIPEPHSLAGSCNLILQFIERDAQAKSSATSEIQLASSAVKLLACFLAIPDIANVLTDDGCASMIDMSITALQDSELSKTLARDHLFTLARQKYNARTLQNERLRRLLEALSNLDGRFSGNSIQALRLDVYRQLFEMVPSAMTARLPDWFEHVLHSMLSSVQDIGKRATKLGDHIAIVVGRTREMHKYLNELFERATEEETYGQLFASHLEALLDNPSTTSTCPLVWSVVTLCFRYKYDQSWIAPTKGGFKTWMSVIQKCLNWPKADKKMLESAYFAWSRLIYVMDPRPTSTKEQIRMAMSPIQRHFIERKDVASYDTGHGRFALSTYCALLYNTLHPNANFEHLDFCWQDFVAVVVEKFPQKSRAHADVACRILCSLFEPSKPWQDHRLTTMSLFRIQEIPSLDSKWVRPRLAKVLKAVEPLLSSATWISDPSRRPSDHQGCASDVWTSLMGSLSRAGEKEITSSNDLKAAVAEIVNVLHRYWRTNVTVNEKRKGLVQRFSFLVTSAVDAIGAAHFADKVLIKTSKEEFEAVSTPSLRPKRGTLQSPVSHLVELLLSPECGDSDQVARLELIQSLLEGCLGSKKTRSAKLGILKDHFQAMQLDSYNNGCLDLPTKMSSLGLALAEEAFSNDMRSELKPTTAGSPGQDYKQVVQLVAACLPSFTRQALPSFRRLYQKLVQTARAETGDGGCALGITEPFAELVENRLNSITEEPLEPVIEFASLILEGDVRPKNARAVAQGRRALYGNALITTKAAERDPYNHFYKMISNLLGRLYQLLQSTERLCILRFFTAFNSTVEQWGTAHYGHLLLKQTQDGISLWIADPEKKLGRTLTTNRDLSAKVIFDVPLQPVHGELIFTRPKSFGIRSSR